MPIVGGKSQIVSKAASEYCKTAFFESPFNKTSQIKPYLGMELVERNKLSLFDDWIMIGQKFAISLCVYCGIVIEKIRTHCVEYIYRIQ